MRDKCTVTGCKRDAEKMWSPLMNKHGAEVPVCLFHFRLRLWWYRGGVYCYAEEPE